jgi:hypothetical protein
MKASTLLALPILAVLMLQVAADDHARPRCPGCACSSFKKVCRLVCEMKEDIDYEYDVDHDDYCLPGVSEIKGKKWVADCKSLLGCRKELIWQPRCTCKVRTRKTLVKVPVIKKVPTYNCVVDRVCCQCGRSEVDAKATQQARQQGIMPESTDTPIVFDADYGSSNVQFASQQPNPR